MPELPTPSTSQPHCASLLSMQASVTRLNCIRELLAAAISIVILVLAALTIYGTWKTASIVESDAAASAKRKDAYDRQKDIMLYAVALLGTVTGYYLGRIPAELHAQQAQHAATDAQAQLHRAHQGTGRAKVALETAREAVSRLTERAQTGQLTLRDGQAVDETSLNSITHAKNEIDQALRFLT